MAELAEALSAAQVGRLSGACTVESGNGWQGSYDITWFGLGDRTTDLRVTVVFLAPEGATLCAAQVVDLIEAIEHHAERVLGLGISPDLR